MDDRAADVVLFEQIENFFFAGFGVQVDEYFLLPRAFLHSSSRLPSRCGKRIVNGLLNLGNRS